MVYHYFLSANSAQGYIDWSAQRAQQLKKVIRITGYPNLILHALEGAALEQAREKGLRLDVIHRPLDGEIAGLIVPSNGKAIFDTPVWLDRSYHLLAILEDKRRDQMQTKLSVACNYYAQAKELHDAWEKIYIRETNFDKLNAFTERFYKNIVVEKREKSSGERIDAFFGAGTSDGPVDYISCLTADLNKRYFLKGRPGTGKSTFLKKVAEAAQSAGYDIEVYHCSFDPNSLDMLIVREMDFCVFDSTAPHEYFPIRTGDEIIDLYAEAVCPGTDERYAAQLSLFAKHYKYLTGKAKEKLGDIRETALTIDDEIMELLDRERMAIALEKHINFLFSQ